MNLKAINTKLTYRKLKISDYEEFNKLFYSCFKKRVSKEFFKSRYFSDKFSFCYGAFEASNLIANVGMYSIKINNDSKERVFSRHSSMVLKKYRGKGIFSDLLKQVKKIISNNYRIIIMWPNKFNFSNFSLDKRNIIKKKYYLYKTISLKKSVSKTKNYPIEDIVKFKNYMKCNDSFFFKNYNYFKNRYLSYKKKEYYINQFISNKKFSFFIVKRNRDKSGLNYVIVDHFGSSKIRSKHLNFLINNQNKLIILSKYKIKKNNFIFLNYLYFKIGFIHNDNSDFKKFGLLNKEIYLGDTDTFITYNS